MRKNLPQLVALRAFEAAARHASFKRAADELCVTPSSVSHQVKKLEDWLGVPLFRRFNRKVVLTDAGRTYFFTLSKTFDEIAEVTALVSRQAVKAPDRKEKLKIFANAGFLECWLGPRLDRVQSVMPDVQLELVPGLDIDDYLRGDAEIAIHYGLGSWPEYESVLLHTAYEFPVCSPRLSQRGRPLKEPRDLAAFRLLHEGHVTPWRDWLAEAGTTHPGLMDGPIFHSTQTIFNQVMACEGVALGDDLVAADLLHSGALIKPIGKVRKSTHSLYVLQLKPDRPSQSAKTFRTWLVSALKEHGRNNAILQRDEPYSAQPVPAQ
ncbi:Glycine cleavage system transcriptional activator [Methyloligella halotolerans]|uniref:Glycine cleavage system transcriptional activator n=1 Tax=Methyloligella halotolerans TaxID=1177755 RepID=A0A1E2RX33_9HYPH|nr:LysR family transcriptional regulator [Methyloligella halotolerans]ODA66806.1 Glycine cleavage system transcriptional activator [Methyloligella halotolerans]